MLQRFLERGYDQITDAEKGAFERLLDLQDPEISRYLMGREEPADGDIAGIVRQIQRITPR